MRDFQSIGEQTKVFPFSRFHRNSRVLKWSLLLFPFYQMNDIHIDFFFKIHPKIEIQKNKNSCKSILLNTTPADIGDAMKMSIFDWTIMATFKIASELTRIDTSKICIEKSNRHQPTKKCILTHLFAFFSQWWDNTLLP